MNTVFFIIGVLVLLTAVCLFVSSRLDIRIRLPHFNYFRNKNSASDNQSSAKWRAVKILPSLIACEMATKLAGRPYLSTEAPHLPLTGCTERKCYCKYIFLDDRRDIEDRRELPEYLTTLFLANRSDRRTSDGRRITDVEF